MRWFHWVIIAAVLAGVLAVSVAVLSPPPVHAPREADLKTASVINLQKIAQAILSDARASDPKHPDGRRFLPQAIFDRKGKPLLSWRVRILRHLDQGDLYHQFHLDEPWDSEHNKKLIADMPEVYRNPSSKAPPGWTTYLAICGKGLMFAGTEGRKMSDITDGTDHTLMLVEANDDRAVPWTKPEDWECDPEHPLAGLGEAHPDGFCAVMAGGGVQFYPKSFNPKTFYTLLTIAGGEPSMLPE